MCDCLERDEGPGRGREYFLHRECNRDDDEDRPENTIDCLDL